MMRQKDNAIEQDRRIHLGLAGRTERYAYLPAELSQAGFPLSARYTLPAESVDAVQKQRRPGT
jgi:DNA ligase (NAD+)